MYSTLATTTDADALDESPFLFSQSHDDDLSMPMSYETAHLKASGSGMVPISGLSNLMYGQYSESTPSSIHFGDTQDISEASGSHMSGREERDGSISSGYVNGQERSYAPSPLHYPHHSQNSRQNGLSKGGIHDISTTSNGDFSGNRPTDKIVRPAETVLSTPSRHARNSQSLMGKTLQYSQEIKPSSTPELSQPHRLSGEKHSANSKPEKVKVVEFRASSSIPSTLSWEEFARQTILAADSSRLNPFALHPEEYKLLRNHITHPQVTIYLNIRNAILRLWTRNPLVNVTLEEAAGCAREKRYFNLAKIAYYWLLRNGYINFGCVEVPNTAGIVPRAKAKGSSQRTVLVVGAGMSGLGCARHMEGLFSQLGEQFTSEGELPPKVVVLEARPRVGGRVYSHPLRNQTNSSLPTGHRCTAEMGAQIVTGYEHGNPMNAIIRGQLGIPYHGLRDNTILYDHDGTVVERSRDILVEKLYNDVLERASVYRNKSASFRTVEGDRNLILFGRDPNDTDGPTIAVLENSRNPLPANASTTASTVEEKPSSGVEKLAGRAYQLTAGFNPNISAAEAVMNMGWQLQSGASLRESLDLNTIAKSFDYPTLGQTMDDGIKQYQRLLNLQPLDLRLLNWHHANLEYANAVSVNQLSLSGWDQDIGNEFEGEHSEIIGGYQQVPRGLWLCPKKLDVRFNTVVSSIQYNTQEHRNEKAVRVECKNGEVYNADHIVLTTPLGVLKSGSVTFEPPLPDWKQGVIERMGFGLLNKVILVYDEAFWEPDRDMFGLLNEAEYQQSLDMQDYSSGRGRFYLFWNCIKTSGRPTLVALMAGDAAHYAEASSNDQLIKEVTGRLTKMFAPKSIPLPSETIVTRWSKDPYARGSYSYVGPKTQAGDYDVMARPYGPLHFAGEATCGTHPATVHGAYLSGLRVAAEVAESMLGPIKISSPLVEKRTKSEHSPSATSPAMTLVPTPNVQSTTAQQAPPAPQNIQVTQTPQAPQAPNVSLNFHAPQMPHVQEFQDFGQLPQNQQDTRNARQLLDEDYEASIIGAILNKVGERPVKPSRAGVNPFLLYTKDYWYSCKNDCDEKRKKATGDPNAKASKTEIRTALGLMWRTASAEVKKPYLELTQNAKDDAAANAASFKERVAAWDREAACIRREYIQNNPPPNGSDDLLNGRTAIELGGGKRIRRI